MFDNTGPMLYLKQFLHCKFEMSFPHWGGGLFLLIYPKKDHMELY